VAARHRNEGLRAIEANRDMAKFAEGLEVPAGPAAEIEDVKGGSPPMDVSSASMFWLTS
jgi:hypothetical protein